MKKIFPRLFTALALATLLVPQLVFAGQGCNVFGLRSGLSCVTNLQQQSGIRNQTPAQLVLSIIAIVLSVAGVLAVGAIVYGGIKYITSAGDEKKADEGKRTLIYAVLGLLIIGAAIIIVNIVLRFIR